MLFSSKTGSDQCLCVIAASVKSFVEIHCSSKTGRGGGGGDCTRKLSFVMIVKNN